MWLRWSALSVLDPSQHDGNVITPFMSEPPPQLMGMGDVGCPSPHADPSAFRLLVSPPASIRRSAGVAVTVP
jgi:hypothetical protein